MPNDSGRGDGAPSPLDRSGWPIVVVTGDGRPVDAGTARAFVAEMDALLAAGDRFGLVMDTGRWPRDAQGVVMGWLAERFTELGRVVAAMATVVPRATVDGSRRYMAVHPEQYPCPADVAGSRAEALAWVAARVTATGETATGETATGETGVGDTAVGR